MNRFYRSLLLTGIVAAGLAGCGDDVTVVDPPPPPPPPAPQVRSVTVTPDNVAVSPGQTVQMSANVTADAGATPTIAWSTSDATRATVSNTGLVSVLANAPSGPVSIRATASCATACGTASGAATLNVVPATANTPTVSISAVNQGANALGLPVGGPANLAATGGQLDVVMNLERNGQVINSLQLLVDTESGDSIVSQQNFGSAAPVEAGAEAVPEQITLSFNSANFVCSATNCAVSFLNRQHTLKGRVSFGVSGSGASNSVQFTLVNANAFTGSLTFTGTVKTANDAAGRKFDRGGLDVSILPVIYTQGVTMSNGTVTFGSALCDASGVGARTRTLTAPAAGSSAFTASFAQTSTGGASASNVMSYEFNNAVCGAGFTNGEFLAVTAVGSNGNNLPLVAAGLPGIRLDNRAPAPPVVVLNPNGRNNGWLNDAVTWTVNSATNPNGAIAAAVPDAGVGGVNYFFRAAAGAGVATGSSTAAAAAAEATSFAGFAVSYANQYCTLSYSQDALENRSGTGTTSSVACTATTAPVTTHGVDRDAPTAVYVDNPPDATAINDTDRLNGGTIGAEFKVMVQDLGTIGNSGFGPAPGVANINRRDATTAAACILGAGATCAPAPLGFLAPNVLSAIAALNTPGYYTQRNVTITDAAGNTTTVGDRVAVFDNVAPTLSPVQFSFANNFYTGGQQQVLNSTANDNLDVWDVQSLVAYPNLTGSGNIDYGVTVLNTFNGTLMNTNVPVAFTIPFFYRSMAAVTGNNPLAFTASGKPLGVIQTLRDQATNAAGQATAWPANSIPNPAATPWGTGAQLTDGWVLGQPPLAPTTLWNGVGTTSTTLPTSTSFTVVANGPTGTFNPPFARVDLYGVHPISGDWVLLGSASGPVTTDDGQPLNRLHTWSFSWAPGVSFGANVVVPVFAVGATASGDALRTLTGINITIQD